jgi:hypothetical protein
MGCVCFSEQTAIVFLNSNNYLISVTEARNLTNSNTDPDWTVQSWNFFILHFFSPPSITSIISHSLSYLPSHLSSYLLPFLTILLYVFLPFFLLYFQIIFHFIFLSFFFILLPFPLFLIFFFFIPPFLYIYLSLFLFSHYSVCSTTTFFLSFSIVFLRFVYVQFFLLSISLSSLFPFLLFPRCFCVTLKLERPHRSTAKGLQLERVTDYMCTTAYIEEPQHAVIKTKTKMDVC